jgi:hypothetical protein
MYDSGKGRWFAPDPARQYWSPYVVMGNNPVSLVDPDGRQANRNDYSNGKDYIPREQSGTSGLSGAEQISLGLRNYGGDYSGSFMDYVYLATDAINQINPIAGLFDYAAYLYGGTDRFGNPMSNFQGTVIAATLLFPAARSLGAGAAKGVVNQTSKAILKNGYYEVNGFKFSEYYYNKLWSTGRGAPSLVANEVLQGGAKTAVPDALKAGFNKYIHGGWEMIYNPATKEVWHLQPIR